MSVSRKDDHIRLAAEQQHAPTGHNGFDDIHLVHHALAGIDHQHVNLTTQVGPWTFPAPLYINGMTGGTGTAFNINQNLARAAAATGIPMASGSVGVALDHPDNEDIVHSFTVIREENPNGIVLANIGAGRPLDDARRAVDLLEADGLQIHLNAIQETVMPEGSREFSSWLGLIEQIVAQLDSPVLIKEVGFGLSARTLTQLSEIGVTLADVSGSGGTNFAQIENDRRTGPHQDYGYLNGFGASTVECLLEAAAHPAPAGMQLLASGGVRTPLDVIRALALGARAVGIAGTFLTVAMEHGAEGLTEVINIWLERLTELHALLGATTPEQLSATDLLIRGLTAETAQLRGINLTPYTQRSGYSSCIPAPERQEEQ